MLVGVLRVAPTIVQSIDFTSCWSPNLIVWSVTIPIDLTDLRVRSCSANFPNCRLNPQLHFDFAALNNNIIDVFLSGMLICISPTQCQITKMEWSSCSFRLWRHFCCNIWKQSPNNHLQLCMHSWILIAMDLGYCDWGIKPGMLCHYAHEIFWQT